MRVAHWFLLLLLVYQACLEKNFAVLSDDPGRSKSQTFLRDIQLQGREQFGRRVRLQLWGVCNQSDESR